jgi:hypothetical protein
MKLARAGAGAAVVAAVLSVLLVAPPAMAAYYPDVPPPSTVLPDAWPGGVLTPEEEAFRKFQISTGIDDLAGKGAGWSRFMPAIRAGGAALGFLVGFTTGAAGLKLIINNGSAADPTIPDWDRTLCSGGEFVAGAYTMLSLGVGASNCNITIRTPNADQGGTITYAGTTLTFWKVWASSPGNEMYCYTASPFTGNVWPSPGYKYYGVGSSAGGNMGPWQGGCGSGYPNYVYARPVAGGGSSGMVVKRDSDGATVAETVTNNPTRETRCGLTLLNGSRVNGEWVTYQESSGYPMSQVADLCARSASSIAGGASSVGGVVLEARTGGAGAPIETMANPTLPDEFIEAKEEYPDCFDGSRRCELKLTRTVGVDVKSCFADPAACANWWTATSNATVEDTAEGLYRCTYGSYSVPLANCAVYERAFIDPAVSNQPGTITDPKTGLQVGTNPGTNGRNTLNPGAFPMAPAEKCMENWFDDINPIDWVMTPAFCAMVLAFVPRPEVVEATFAPAADLWESKAPAVIIEAVGNLTFDPGSSGCNLALSWDGMNGEAGAMCSGLVGELPLYSRIITSAYVGIMVWNKLRQQVAAMANYNVGQT